VRHDESAVRLAPRS